MICQQVKHHHDWLVLISSLIFHFWVLLKTLVVLRFMPNDGHEARKWSCELHFDCHYRCTMWIWNQVKLRMCWAYWDIISCSYILVCILFVALCPYVSMGIVAYLGQLLAIYNVWTDFIWSCSLWETYVNFCRLLTNESEDSNCIVSLLDGGSSSEVDILFDSYWLNIIFSCGADVPVSDAIYYDSFDYYLYGIWNHIDTSQLNNAI